jgi:hypothetical protein
MASACSSWRRQVQVLREWKTVKPFCRATCYSSRAFWAELPLVYAAHISRAGVCAELLEDVLLGNDLMPSKRWAITTRLTCSPSSSTCL